MKNKDHWDAGDDTTPDSGDGISASRCGAAPAPLFGLIDGALTAEERPALELHVQRCASCRAELEELQKMDQLLRWSSDQLKTRLAPTAQDFTARVRAKVAAQAEPSGGALPFSSRPIASPRLKHGWAWGAAAAVALAATVVFALAVALTPPLPKEQTVLEQHATPDELLATLESPTPNADAADPDALLLEIWNAILEDEEAGG